MKARYRIILLLAVAAGSFLAGLWVTQYGGNNKSTTERKILHYVDPMNPAFKSDKPGIAPCGMALEPVYADSRDSVMNGSFVRASMPPGTIRISPEKQQLIGIKITTVEKAPWSHTLRVLGRVTPDETRVYRINAAVNGWIDNVLPVTTGSLVKKNQLLATFYSLEYRSLLQSYFTIISSGKSGSPSNKPEEPSARYSAVQLKQMRDTIRTLGQSTENAQADYYKKNLFNYGMSEYQLEEIERTRKIPDVLEIRAPNPGFILSRNVSPGLRFDRGVEFFRIVDLSNVWILADVFENESSFFKPGLRVKMELPYQKKTLYARMSNVLPQFDSTTRTLKIRLEADNPGYALRPDMFVNVEIPFSGPAAIIVPMDAVVDSGLKKTVFVDRGNGYFEPRQVEAGRSLGERVEIARGLMPGEKIVVSGNFLIDSEARMQLANTGISGKVGRDEVCGMNIDEDQSRAAGYMREYKGKTYFFCSTECRDEFVKMPERYLSPSTELKNMPPYKTKARAVAEHTSHGAMKKAEPDGAKVGPHDHNGAKMAMPKDPRPSSPSSGAAPVHGENSGVMFLPPAGATTPMLPGQGAGSAGPDLHGPTSMPSQMPGGMFPPPGGATTPMLPGRGTGVTMPGAPGAVIPVEPKTEEAVRSTSRPPRRKGSGPFVGGSMPGIQGGPSAPQSTSNGMLPTGPGPAKTEQKMKAAGDGQNHD